MDAYSAELLDTLSSADHGPLFSVSSADCELPQWQKDVEYMTSEAHGAAARKNTGMAVHAVTKHRTKLNGKELPPELPRMLWTGAVIDLGSARVPYAAPGFNFDPTRYTFNSVQYYSSQELADVFRECNDP